MMRILNIGLDRDLMAPAINEAIERQQIYSHGLPARFVHLIKAPPGPGGAPRAVGPELAVVPVPVRHWSQFPLAAYRRGADVMMREPIDLIQTQDPLICGLAGAWLARRFGKPLVVGVYSDEIDNPVWLAERPLNRIANQIAKRVLRRAALVRCDSADVAGRLLAAGFANVRYVPFLITRAAQLAAPTPDAAARRRTLLDGRRGPLLVTVSRLEAEKNIAMLLRAFAAATELHDGIVLAVAGDGRLRAELEALAARIASGRVRWLGRVGADDLPALYQAADLTLLSSQRESAARVLSESLLAGTPVLTTATGGAHDIVTDKVSGRVVPVGDERAFAAALGELCEDRDRLGAMGAAGHERMVTTVAPDAVVMALRTLYADARVMAR